MNSWNDYVVEGRKSDFIVHKRVIANYGDFVIVFGGMAGGLDRLRIGSGFLVESDRENYIKLKRLVNGEILYLGFDEIELIKVDVKNVSKLRYEDQPVIAACDDQIGIYSAGTFSRKGDKVAVHSMAGIIIGEILTLGTKGVKIGGHGVINFDIIRKIISLKFSTQPKLAKDCTPTELREIADLKEHIEYQKVKIAKLEQDAQVASFKINHQAETIKKKDSQIYGLYASNQKLKEGFWKEEARANRAYDLIDLMPKVIVNHYKNKLAKQGY